MNDRKNENPAESPRVPQDTLDDATRAEMQQLAKRLRDAADEILSPTVP